MAPRLVMIYNADGTLRGEIRYVVGARLLGRLHCELCDITHGPVRRKQAWAELVDALEAREFVVEVLHRNEVDPSLGRLLGDRLPCVVAITGSGDASDATMLLGPDDLGACHGRVDLFGAALDQALSSLDASSGGAGQGST